MAVICAYRSTQTALWYNSAKAGATMAQLRLTATSALAITNTAAETNCFGAKYLDMASAGSERAAMWPGFENTPATASTGFALLIRIIPRFSGTSAATDLFAIGGSTTQFPGRMNFAMLAAGTLRFSYADMDGASFVSITTTALKTDFVSGTAVDLMFSWDGSTAANAAVFGINGTVFQSVTAATAMYANVGQVHRTGISIGCGPNAATSNWDLNEFVIFNNATPVTTGVRSDFWTVATTDLSTYSDPGVANIINGVSYTIAGVSAAGTYVTASVANVRSGTTFGAASASTGTLTLPSTATVKIATVFDGTAQTGSYTGADRWTDPGLTNVKLGTVYTANATSVTGSLNVTGGSTGLAMRSGFYKTIG